LKAKLDDNQLFLSTFCIFKVPFIKVLEEEKHKVCWETESNDKTRWRSTMLIRIICLFVPFVLPQLEKSHLCSFLAMAFQVGVSYQKGI